MGQYYTPPDFIERFKSLETRVSALVAATTRAWIVRDNPIPPIHHDAIGTPGSPGYVAAWDETVPQAPVKPAASNANQGRIAFNEETGTFQGSTGSAWVNLS